MNSYYAERLSAERLQKCYDLAPPRIRQYLKAEVDHVLKKIKPGDVLLDLGCGYGRIIPSLSQKAGFVVGIDIAHASLILGKDFLRDIPNCALLEMNAVRLGFLNGSFDAVVCLQNGISAFHVDPRKLIRECLRVTKAGGTILLSTYSDQFWPERLHWFRLQSAAGLLGEIDPKKTGDGVIVCKDGFKATTVGPDHFRDFTSGIRVQTSIIEVDHSSLFCEISKPRQPSLA